MSLPDIFDPSKPHRCPIRSSNPLTCSCATCHMARQSAKAQAALDRARARNFAPTGGGLAKVAKPQEAPKETAREKFERQRRERIQEREEDWNALQANEARYAAHRKKILDRRKLESEILKATKDLLIFLPTLDLETSIHSQAVKEFSEAFDVILKGYNKNKITYEVGRDLIHQIKDGFIDGGSVLSQLEKNRQMRNAEKINNISQDGDYQRNLVVNNESFNVRFKASCATPECLMRNANIDMEDAAFQDYIEEATQDKRSDVMQVINTALILNPYLKTLEGVANLDSAYSIASGDFDPAWSTAMGKGAVYRLRLLNLSERALKSIENTTAYITGEVLSERKED